MSSPRNPGFEEAVTVMERAYKAARIGGCTQREARTAALTKLLDAKQTETCKTCGGATILINEAGVQVICPDCTAGRVPGTLPLVILGPTLAHPTVKISDDVPGWEGVTLPAAYHDPLRDGSFDFGSPSE